MVKHFRDRKLIACRACGKRKDQSEFDWLQKQFKFHHDCTACTKSAVTRDRRYLVY